MLQGWEAVGGVWWVEKVGRILGLWMKEKGEGWRLYE